MTEAGSQVVTGVTGVEHLETAGTTPDERRNAATALEVMRGFAAGDFSQVRAKLVPGATTWVLGFGPGGPSAHYAPDILPKVFCNGMHFHVHAAAADGPMVFLEWDDEATTANGSRYANDGISVFRFAADGRIEEYREYIDPAQVRAAVDQ